MNNIKSWLVKNRRAFVPGFILCLILLLSLFLRCYQIGKLSFWQDELFTANFVKADLKSLPALIYQRDVNMSLFSLLANLWGNHINNLSESNLRILPAIISVVSVLVVYFLGKSLSLDKKKSTIVGMLSAFFLSINAYHIQYAQEFRGYSLFFLLTSLSTLIITKIIEDPDNLSHWFFYAICSALAFYAHIFAVTLTASHLVILIYLQIKNKSYHFFKIFYLLLFLLALISPLMFAIYIKGSGQISWISQVSINTIRFFLITITGTEVGLSQVYLYLVPISILVLIRGIKNKNISENVWRQLLLLASLFLPIMIALAFSLLIKPIFVDRYLFFIMPYLLILVVHGLVEPISVGRWKSQMFFSFIIIFLMTILSVKGVLEYYKSFKKKDYRSVAKYMLANCNDALIIYYPQYIELYVPFYAQSLKSQVEDEQMSLYTNQLTIANKMKLTTRYRKVCLMTGSIFLGIQKDHVEEMQHSLSYYFGKNYIVQFEGGLEVNLFTK